MEMCLKIGQNDLLLRALKGFEAIFSSFVVSYLTTNLSQFGILSSNHEKFEHTITPGAIVRLISLSTRVNAFARKGFSNVSFNIPISHMTIKLRQPFTTSPPWMTAIQTHRCRVSCKIANNYPKFLKEFCVSSRPPSHLELSEHPLKRALVFIYNQ